jgi:uncharacterized protein YxjI
MTVGSPPTAEETRSRAAERTGGSGTVLDHNLFLVKEHVGMFKAANAFDIHDPETGQLLLEAREPQLGGFTKLLRFTRYKRHTPFRVEIADRARTTRIVVHRGVSFFVSKVLVEGGDGRALGSFQQKLFSIGGSFRLFGASGQEIAQVVGKWTTWDFRVLCGERELARVTKKWAGLGKELFTSADNYVVAIDAANVPPGDGIRPLILSAAVCIDMVLKE